MRSIQLIFVRRGSSSETGVQTQLDRSRAHEKSSTDLTAEGLKDLKDSTRAKGGGLKGLESRDASSASLGEVILGIIQLA